jgi:hypothetical protein
MNASAHGPSQEPPAVEAHPPLGNSEAHPPEWTADTHASSELAVAPMPGKASSAEHRVLQRSSS